MAGLGKGAGRPTANTLWGKSSVPAGMVTVIEVVPPTGTAVGVPDRTGPDVLSRCQLSSSSSAKPATETVRVAGNELMVDDGMTRDAELVTASALSVLCVPVHVPKSGVTV